MFRVDRDGSITCMSELVQPFGKNSQAPRAYCNLWHGSHFKCKHREPLFNFPITFSDAFLIRITPSKIRYHWTMASRPTASRPPTGSSNPSRRHLFHGHQLIRRPTGPATTVAAATTHSHIAVPETRYDDSLDVVMREPNGEPQVQMLQPLLVVDEAAAGGSIEALKSDKERTCAPQMVLRGVDASEADTEQGLRSN